MKLTDFNFELPESHIARFPSDKRDESRLMLVNRQTGNISHHQFKDILNLIDLDQSFFVVNNSKVIPVKLFGHIDGKKVEMLIVKMMNTTEAEVLTLPAKRFTLGGKIIIEQQGTHENDSIQAEVIQLGHRGRRVIRFNHPIENVLQTGYAPLPPYIKRKYEDAVKYRSMDLERYQTVYSKTPGSIAAPTAGLHFTPDIIRTIKEKTQLVEITLEVGETTFKKIEVDDIDQHQMGREWITITNEDRKRILELKETRKLTAVGTTSVRSLETWAHQQPQDERFYSEIFITPGFQFKMVDRLITNFHLPESTLFILVCAFGGMELMHKAYRIAIDNGYRFFSYGDSMLII